MRPVNAVNRHWLTEFGSLFATPRTLSSCWERRILIKYFGGLVGVALLIYGTLAVMVNRMSPRNPARKNFCWAVPCSNQFDSLATLTLASSRSVAEAKTALVVEPASAYRWIDLAEAQLNTNDVDAAKYSLIRALAAGPGSPAILFRAARFYLRLEDYPNTLAKLTAILRNPDLSDYYSRVFTIYRQMDMPLATILNEGIPHNEGAATGFLSFWIAGNQMDEAKETWTWLNQNSLVDVDAAAEYVSLLAKNGSSAEAVKIWADFNARNDPDFLKTNWIFNGSFESEPADCLFDWTVSSNSELTASIDSSVNYGGASSLKLTFRGPQKNKFQILRQDVLLAPGSWTVRAYMKASRLSGGTGLFFHVTDPADGSRINVSTKGFEGTQEWSQQETTFLVPPASRMVQVELWAPQAGEGSGEIPGTVWFDHLQLIPAR